MYKHAIYALVMDLYIDNAYRVRSGIINIRLAQNVPPCPPAMVKSGKRGVGCIGARLRLDFTPSPWPTTENGIEERRLGMIKTGTTIPLEATSVDEKTNITAKGSGENIMMG